MPGSITRDCPLKPVVKAIFGQCSWCSSSFGCAQTFCTSVDQWLEVVHVARIVKRHINELLVDPSSCLYRIKTTHHQRELLVIIIVLVLDLADVGSDLNTFAPLLHESRSCCGFRLPNI